MGGRGPAALARLHSLCPTGQEGFMGSLLESSVIHDGVPSSEPEPTFLGNSVFWKSTNRLMRLSRREILFWKGRGRSRWGNQVAGAPSGQREGGTPWGSFMVTSLGPAALPGTSLPFRKPQQGTHHHPDLWLKRGAAHLLQEENSAGFRQDFQTGASPALFGRESTPCVLAVSFHCSESIAAALSIQIFQIPPLCL